MKSPVGGILAWRDRGVLIVVEAMARAALNYRNGAAMGFERMAEYVASDLVSLVEVERLKSKVGGRPDVVPLALRVTTRPSSRGRRVEDRASSRGSDHDSSARRVGDQGVRKGPSKKGPSVGCCRCY